MPALSLDCRLLTVSYLQCVIGGPFGAYPFPWLSAADFVVWVFQNLLIPPVSNPLSFRNSPLYGAPTLPRDILLFFRGDVGLHRLPWYSRGIRQKLYVWSKEYQWREKCDPDCAPC
jgi:hypothetical protein